MKTSLCSLNQMSSRPPHWARRGLSVFFSSASIFYASEILAADAGVFSGDCTEIIPQGANKPTLEQRVPTRGQSGHLIELEIVVRHENGETATLPGDLPQLFSKGTVRLSDDGSWGRSSPPKSVPDSKNPGKAITLLKVPFVALTTSTQRQKVTLPPVRVIVLRKGGGDMSVCTQPHELEIDQPIANWPDPQVRPNPPSVPQVTRDERAQSIAMYTTAGIVAGALLMAALIAYLRRPKPVPPPPPPRPAFDVAMEHIGLTRTDFAMGRIPTKVYYDRLSDALRLYLGEKYALNALEMTSEELLVRLKRLPSPNFPLTDIARFLAESDLVKFAGYTPPKDTAEPEAAQVERIVRIIHEGVDTSWLKPLDSQYSANRTAESNKPDVHASHDLQTSAPSRDSDKFKPKSSDREQASASHDTKEGAP